jgi:hypothetical protein
MGLDRKLKQAISEEGRDATDTCEARDEIKNARSNGRDGTYLWYVSRPSRCPSSGGTDVSGTRGTNVPHSCPGTTRAPVRRLGESLKSDAR